MLNEEEVKDKVEESNKTDDEHIEEVVVEENHDVVDLLVEINSSEDELLSKGKQKIELKEEIPSGSFIKRLLSNIIDQIVCAGSSIILLYCVSIILPIFNYRLVTKLPMLIIIYIVVNILYSAILESTKLKNTLGKALLKL